MIITTAVKRNDTIYCMACGQQIVFMLESYTRDGQKICISCDTRHGANFCNVCGKEYLGEKYHFLSVALPDSTKFFSACEGCFVFASLFQEGELG